MLNKTGGKVKFYYMDMERKEVASKTKEDGHISMLNMYKIGTYNWNNEENKCACWI